MRKCYWQKVLSLIRSKVAKDVGKTIFSCILLVGIRLVQWLWRAICKIWSFLNAHTLWLSRSTCLYRLPQKHSAQCTCYTKVIIVAFCHREKFKTFKSASTGKQLNKIWHIWTVEYFKQWKNTDSMSVLMWKVLHDVLLSGKCQKQVVEWQRMKQFIWEPTTETHNIIYFLWVHRKSFGKITPKLITFTWGGRRKNGGMVNLC